MKTNDKSVKAVALKAFPEYRGRKFRFEVQKYPLNLRSSWEGGSRDFFKVIRLSDLYAIAVPAQSGFDPAIAGLESVTVPEGFAIVQHTIFCGKDLGLTVFVNPANAAAVLPEAVQS